LKLQCVQLLSNYAFNCYFCRYTKTGKPMMSRSVPPSRKKKEEIVKTNTEEEELKAGQCRLIL